MKKIYISLFTVLAGLSMHAQLTQANQAPAANYTFALYHCDSVNVNPGASGANAAWNFSTIATYSTLVSNYVTSAVSGSPNYPSATEAISSSANNTSYYSSTASSLSYYGGNISVGQVAAALIYTNAAVEAIYPMILNSSATSAIGGSINVTSPLATSGTFSGNAHVVADGTGTLMLPGTNSTFTNAIRLVTSQTINITTSFATATVNQVVYDYYSVGIRNPIFTIFTATATIGGFAGSTSTQTTVTRDKNAVTTATTTTTTPTFINENTGNTANFSVYPNPSSTYVMVTGENPDAKNVNVYDITGKFIDRQTFTDGKAKLDVSGLNTGLYIYTITGSNNNALKTGKITVNH